MSTGALLAPSNGPGNPGVRPLLPSPLPQPLLRFTAGQAAAVDLGRFLEGPGFAAPALRLWANLSVGPAEARRRQPFLSFESQYREYRVDGTQLHYNGSAWPAVSPGASAARLQIQAAHGSFDEPSAVAISDVTWIVVDTPLARIRHGLDSWPSFDALTAAVRGTAAPGSAPRGRTDLIGSTFDITPGMFSEGHQSRFGAPVAMIEFPCTVRAADLRQRPVFRSVTGQRDII